MRRIPRELWYELPISLHGQGPGAGHTRLKTLRYSDIVVILAATQAGCSNITGLAELEKNDCAFGCGDATAPGADAASADSDAGGAGEAGEAGEDASEEGATLA